MKDIEIVASARNIPEQVVTNDDLSQIMDTSDEWIKQRTGIKVRHISAGENTSDLAINVAKVLLKQVSWQADDLDLIIVATMSPDNMTPAVGAMVQGALGAKKAIAFDISAACSGFSYAISIAQDIMIANNFKNAMVIGAEVLSKLLDWQDRTTSVLFGDGAGGVLLRLSSTRHLLAKDLNTFGDLADNLVAGSIAVADSWQDNLHHISAFKMNGREVYRFATHNVPKSILSAAKKANISLDEIDHYLLHQANSRIITQVARKLKQPIEKFPVNISEYGNTAAASEAILLAECLENKVIKPGETIILSGFGGGLTTASLIYKF
ncbi:3-oxoacyl-[acyl-carrier-protein] synthase-3 [Lactobacillus colini]|uniref:Beta-ketoacyl-[acyl-carrier-protein] synthase III n=1 Tax=Lactobacillus colini TaxID=1819254 RepID=A0ABS4MD64_9LACO|nr:beta-ketoacyl-ACP synthase III [Lactobacillus colini]MBP2057624.1 3-oxoacyl-[acyl-carrier-protein] synthase-3 [Lactobacillus colini]